jgi:hypothetical protein
VSFASVFVGAITQPSLLERIATGRSEARPKDPLAAHVEVLAVDEGDRITTHGITTRRSPACALGRCTRLPSSGTHFILGLPPILAQNDRETLLPQRARRYELT